MSLDGDPTTKFALAELATHIGEEVTVWPQVGRGESRDTEPGLQPWKAMLVGVGLDPLGNPSGFVSENGLPAQNRPIGMDFIKAKGER